MIDNYLKETEMLDYSNAAIQELIQKKKWKELDEFERIKGIYNFVRDDILFGTTRMMRYVHQKFY